MSSSGETLSGSLANAGAVVHVGDRVLRPTGPNAAVIHALLAHVRAAGFHEAPEPLGFEADGRERLGFIGGDVPIPPFPAWSQTDEVLVSTAVLLRRYHAAAASFVPSPGAMWSRELADPRGGSLICHNDVCPENVVYRNGMAAGLLDFDFAAPGRAVYDLAQLAKLCVPIDTPEDMARRGRAGLDPFRRLRVVADAYGLPPGRAELIDAIGDAMTVGVRFVEQRLEQGDPAFEAMWDSLGGSERVLRRRAWFERHRARFVEALG